MPLNAVAFALLQFALCLATDFDGISMPIAATGPLAPWVCLPLFQCPHSLTLLHAQTFPDTVTIVLPCYNCVPYIEETVQRCSVFTFAPSALTLPAALSLLGRICDQPWPRNICEASMLTSLWWMTAAVTRHYLCFAPSPRMFHIPITQSFICLQMAVLLLLAMQVLLLRQGKSLPSLKATTGTSSTTFGAASAHSSGTQTLRSPRQKFSWATTSTHTGRREWRT